MKVYVDANDIGKTVTYKEEYGKRQYLYVHDNEGFIFKDLADYIKQAQSNIFNKIKSEYAKRLSAFMGTKMSVSTAIAKLDEVLDQFNTN